MATYTVSSGQQVIGTTLHSGDTMTVLNGGSAISTTINGINNGSLDQASQYVFGSSDGTILNYGAYQEVESGGVADNVLVNNLGNVNVDVGGTAYDITMNNGSFGYSAGNINGITLNSGAFLNGAGGVITGAVLNGGQISEQTTSIDKGTVINKGGVEEAYNGNPSGGLFNSVVNSGGLQLVDGANATGTTVNKGGELHVTGGNIIEQYFHAGDSYNAVINSGGLELVETIPGNGGDGQPFWAFSNATIVNSGGTLEVHAGGEALQTEVKTGGFLDNDSTAFNAILNGGTLNDNAGGSDIGTTVNSGADEIVWAGATSVQSEINAGGVETINSGTSTDNVINSGGFMGVWGKTSDNTINSGGKEAVYNGGIDSGMTIGTGGMAFIRAGGQETGTVTFSGTGSELTLATAASGFKNATIAGFGPGDAIDFANTLFKTIGYSGNALTLTNATETAVLHFAGSYNVNNFDIVSDGAGGDLVKFVKFP
jgi:autotransporter passenger strand-loop-strand repeat protein